MIKILQKMGREGTYLKIIKAIQDKPTANIILTGERQSIPSKIRNKTRVPILTIIIRYSLGSPSHGNQRRKINKRYPDLGFPGDSDGKESACSAGDQFQSLGHKDPLEKRMATYSGISVWKIPWREEPGGLQSMRLQKVKYD